MLDKLEIIQKRIKNKENFIIKSEWIKGDDVDLSYISTNELDDAGNFVIALKKIIGTGEYLILRHTEDKTIAYVFLKVGNLVFNAFDVYDLADYESKQLKKMALDNFLIHMKEKYVEEFPIFFYRKFKVSDIYLDKNTRYQFHLDTFDYELDEEIDSFNFFITEKDEYIRKYLNTTNTKRINVLKKNILKSIYGANQMKLDAYFATEK